MRLPLLRAYVCHLTPLNVTRDCDEAASPRRPTQLAARVERVWPHGVGPHPARAERLGEVRGLSGTRKDDPERLARPPAQQHRRPLALAHQQHARRARAIHHRLPPPPTFTAACPTGGQLLFHSHTVVK
eukprot:scaffold137923_cov31-Tisochrysis_lutea.AAC.2